VELHGTLIENLRAAIHSSKRLQGQRVYPETLRFWSDLVLIVRRRQDKAVSFDAAALASLADELEREIERHRDR